ncbi:hypothetical protein [Sinorhizobium meliloti]
MAWSFLAVGAAGVLIGVRLRVPALIVASFITIMVSVTAMQCLGFSGDCQEFCAVGHDDEKERIITWLSRKNFWTSSWLDVIHPRFSARTVCWTI